MIVELKNSFKKTKHNILNVYLLFQRKTSLEIFNFSSFSKFNGVFIILLNSF